MALKDNKNELRKFKVTRAYQFKNGNVAINLEIAGITIYDCILVKKNNPEKGDSEYFVSFPQKRVKDDYFSIVWTNLTPEEEDDIISQVDEMV